MASKANKENLILVMGDAHITNDQDLSRFDLAGKAIVEMRPDYVVIIGDFLTLNCLSAWDRDKRKAMEGRRYELEIESGNEALDKIQAPLKELHKKQAKSKTKKYMPKMIFIEGNHEERLTRFLDKDPTFDGHVSIYKDLKLKQRKFEWVNYGEYYYVNGVAFTHIPFNKVGPISGIGLCRKAQQVIVSSCVFGHSHEACFENRHIEGMQHLQQMLNCGCFFEEHEPYTYGKVTNYWKGLMLLTNYDEGRFDISTYSMSRLKNMFSRK